MAACAKNVRQLETRKNTKSSRALSLRSKSAHSKMNYYRRFIGDYQSDTGHLSILEHGAYTLLLDLYYATGRPIPSDLSAACKIIRATNPNEKKAVESILQEFWESTEDGWINERASREMGKVTEYRKKQSTAAKARGRLATREPPAIPKLATNKPMPNHIQIHSISKAIPKPKPKEKKQEAPSALMRSQDEIFCHWNSQNELTTHRALSSRLRSALKARLTNGYTVANIKQAITRYAELCRAECAPGHNHWGLFELISRGEGHYIDKHLNPAFDGFKTDEQRADAKKRKLREEIRARDAKRAAEGDQDENY